RLSHTCRSLFPYPTLFRSKKRQENMNSGFTPMTVAEIVEAITAPPLPFHVTGFDGSETGPADARLRLDITSSDALAYIVTAPGRSEEHTSELQSRFELVCP